MLTRRSFFRFLTWLTGGAGVAAVAPVADQGMEAPPSLGSHASLITVPALWFFDDSTGQFWHAADIFQWMDWNLPQAVIERAKQGLEENIGLAQLMRLLRRRRWQQYAAAGVGHFAGIPRDHVHMHMRHGLASGAPRVEADVVTVGPRLKPLIQQPLHFAHEPHEGGLLVGRAHGVHAEAPRHPQCHAAKR